MDGFLFVVGFIYLSLYTSKSFYKDNKLANPVIAKKPIPSPWLACN